MMKLLDWRGLIPVKLECPAIAGCPSNLTANTSNQLSHYATSPSNMAYGAIQNSLLWSRRLPILIPPTRGGMARLSWLEWLIKYQDSANYRKSTRNLSFCSGYECSWLRDCSMISLL